MKIYGLIGYPLGHSLSPAMHNAAFAHLKINSEYKLFPLREEELGNFLKNIRVNNIYGLNITVPYKEKILAFLDGISQEAKLIGAVNTLKSSAGKLKGFNTDSEGFLRHLTVDLKFNPKEKKIAIIGAGGASRAVSISLAKLKPGALSIFDVDRKKLIALAGILKTNFKNLKINPAGSIVDLGVEACDLLINATAVGLKESDPCLVDERFIHRGMLVYDLIYNPAETRLLRMAKEKGAKTANGLGMLLYQGARSFELWTGKRAPVKIMRQALEEAIKR